VMMAAAPSCRGGHADNKNPERDGDPSRSGCGSCRVIYPI